MAEIDYAQLWKRLRTFLEAPVDRDSADVLLIMDVLEEDRKITLDVLTRIFTKEGK